MSNEINEKLSALIDSELPVAEVDEILSQLSDEEPLREQWQRMHLIRDVAQGEMPASILGHSFSASVMAALENDELPVAADDSNVVPLKFSTKQKPTKSSPSWVRPITGLAIAASVAMVSVVSLRLVQEPSDVGLPLVAEAEQESDFVAEATAVAQLPFQSVNTADFKRVNNTGTYWVVDKEKVRDSELESHLNGYLSDHIEFATMRNVGGMLPYSKLVGYDEIRK